MLKSKIETKHGKPCLYVDGQPMTAMAYTTYFPERNRYQDFIDAGYRIFFVNISFTTLPINTKTLFTPFHFGVFENPEKDNYSEFEEYIHGILKYCPDAVIFPRIYISMPQWWVESHPNDVYMTDKGDLREVMFSEAFRRDGSEMLKSIIQHIKESEYAHRIGGWMICGGLTQEWMYRDYRGDISPAAQEPYRLWVKETYGIDHDVLPRIDEYNYVGNPLQSSENAKRYSFFTNLAMAKSVDIFAGTIKRETNFDQVVGTFYGYVFETVTPMFGSYALRSIIDSPNLDFFSSPNAYTNARAFGIDWADMMPVHSIKSHGKLCFIECDIRTYLTTSIQEARRGEYPIDIYQTKNGASVWAGPPTTELSREALRKSFAHQITNASAIWWFDMWGGWYDDPILMDELCEMKKICDNDLISDKSDVLSSDVVFFADEQGYANMMTDSPQIRSIKHTRTAMGNTGVPYDSCMVEDAELILQNYKAAVFPFPLPSDAGKHAMELCEKMGIPYLMATADHYELTADEIRVFLKANGIHFYTEEKDVVYVGNGYIGLHSVIGGTKRLRLPRTCTVSSVFGTELSAQVTDCIKFELKENATALFAVSQ